MRKLSVLLPTHNRLEYLRFAVATVLQQDSPDWEIVISDNASADDIGSYVAELDDPRIIYGRSNEFLPVTDNWNRALSLASGDYVLMLGDDDGLLPGYVRRISQLADAFDAPDLIYTGALLLTYPGVAANHPDGRLTSESYASFFRGRQAPFVLPPAAARKMVKHAMHFRVRYGFNMQFAVVSRELIARLAPHGPFFQAAFPDYYAMNVCFLNARRIAVDPAHRVVIGVTPKSYGYFHTHGRETEGRAFLDAETVVAPPPGTNINVGWLSALEAIELEYGSQFRVRVDRRRYRLLQALNVYGRKRSGESVDPNEIRGIDRELRGFERVAISVASGTAAGRVPAVPQLMRRVFAFLLHRALRQYPNWAPPSLDGRYANMLELFDAAQAGDGQFRSITRP